ncbi:MAG TPA: YceD family protein [Candidatus Saccharimonadales bacterium]|nr:YceD family protein [Candidatus Saccharimonadales bacterium]
MHINVSHILAGDVGASTDFTIEGEYPNIPDLELSQPVSGQFSLTKLDEGLALKGSADLVFKLECYRCLDTYEHQAQVNLTGLFNLNPGEDEWPITRRGEIDLTPLLRQEALVSIPIQQLCSTDCAGLCTECGQRQTKDHKHEIQELGNRPRIKKGP